MEALLGTWRLQSAQELNPLGDCVSLLLEPNPMGLLCYNRDGFVFVHLSAGERLAQNAIEREQPNSVYYGYVGRFELRGNQVYHHVEISRDPNIMGKTFKRSYHLDGDLLSLSWRHGEVNTGRIVWQRVSGD